MKKRLTLVACLIAIAPLSAAQAEERHVYYGDLHLHTRLSFDAFTAETTMPEDTYRFAMGEPVTALGQTLQRHVPLDFLAITDHAEYLGVLQLAADEHGPFAGTEWPKGLNATNPQERAAVQVRIGRSWRKGPIPEFRTPQMMHGNWQYQIDTAEKFYRPGKFTTLVAFEYSSTTPKGENLHRNVIFRGPKYPEVPFSMIDSDRPEDLWAYADNNRRNGIDSVIIPHNANLSGGLMFASSDSDGKPISRDYAETRARNELLVEISQIKGTSETRPELSPNDEFAGFELLSVVTFLGGFDTAVLPASYVRPALGRGLEIQSQIGVYPFPLGFVGATDLHTGLSASEPDNHPADPKRVFSRQKDGAIALTPLDESSGGMTGVWAEENTRESIFAALKRKEVFATSGTRIKLRVFAGWTYPKGTMDQANWTEIAYRGGVPMGGRLARSQNGSAQPRLLLQALKDPNSGNLDRIQVVKIWQKQGAYEEKVFDAVWSGNRTIDRATGKLPPIGNTVDAAKAEYTNSIGAAELKGEWQDKEFDPKARAIYYVRVLEIPTPRWTTYLAVRNNLPLPPDIPAAIQQRAWSSPIAYEP